MAGDEYYECTVTRTIVYLGSNRAPHAKTELAPMNQIAAGSAEIRSHYALVTGGQRVKAILSWHQGEPFFAIGAALDRSCTI
jgi:hypothetical protein